MAFIIGCVINYYLNCGPSSGYLKQGVGSLVAAKYQFYLTKPENTPFAADFDKVLQYIEQLQSATAASPVHQNFIVMNGQSCDLYFTCNVFEKHVSVPHFIISSLVMTLSKAHKINPPDASFDDLDNPSSQSECYDIVPSADHLTVLHKVADVELVDSEMEN